jgi:hypothetical protein
MSLRIVRKDKEILLFPFLSGLITILILASFFLGAFFTVGFEGMFSGAGAWMFYAFLIAFYFAAFFISIFFNVAVIGCATIRMNGGDPTVADGFRIAGENVRQILLWALFAATVGLILRAVQQRTGFIGRILVGALGAAFTIAAYFVVPVFVYEKLGPWKALKRSVSILKGTWGEALIGNLGLGAVFLLLGLGGLIPIIVGALLANVWAIVAGVTIAIVYWLVLGLVASAAQSVLVAALYRYATTGKVSEDFAGLSFDNPWAVPKRI